MSTLKMFLLTLKDAAIDSKDASTDSKRFSNWQQQMRREATDLIWLYQTWWPHPVKEGCICMRPGTTLQSTLLYSLHYSQTNSTLASDKLYSRVQRDVDRQGRGRPPLLWPLPVDQHFLPLLNLSSLCYWGEKGVWRRWGIDREETQKWGLLKYRIFSPSKVFFLLNQPHWAD